MNRRAHLILPQPSPADPRHSETGRSTDQALIPRRMISETYSAPTAFQKGQLP